ncbi:MAG: putative toxin-antitoxin system toxin component, PIN family [Bacteroidota bacterium]|nr:putative toxin-antitoxin system toxin component, PIN family [Bacteroidota bacterium]
MRLILDTNILVSAFIFKSETANNVVRISANKHTLLFSESTFKELKSTLLKQKFAGVAELSTISNFLFNLVRIGEFIEPKIEITECRDPKDNKFLELAVAGNAACIVTGDNDLLVLDPFRNIRIITPKEFLDQF